MPPDTPFLQRLQENQRPVVVDFWATWCGPCRAIEPFLRKLDKEYAEQVDLWRINADDHPDLLRHFGVRGIPTLIAFRRGQEVVRLTGASSFEILAEVFEHALHGEPLPAILAPQTRLPRAAIGLALLLLAYSGGFSGLYEFIALLGGLLALSTLYDFYPLWQTLAPRLRRWFGRDKKTG